MLESHSVLVVENVRLAGRIPLSVAVLVPIVVSFDQTKNHFVFVVGEVGRLVDRAANSEVSFRKSSPL